MRLALALGIAMITGFALLPLAAAQPHVPGCDQISACQICVYGQPDCNALYCTGYGTSHEQCTPYPCQYCVPLE